MTALQTPATVLHGRARALLAAASALVAACVLVPDKARALDARDGLRMGIATIVVAIAAQAAMAYRGRARLVVTLAGGAVVWLAADVGLLSLLAHAAPTRGAVLADAGLGVVGVSGLLLALRAARSRDGGPGAAESLIASGAWVLVAGAWCAIAPTELRRLVALSVAGLGAIALAGGFAFKLREAGPGRALAALGSALLAMVGWSALLALYALAYLGIVGGMSVREGLASPPCDLETRFFSTAGTRITRADEPALAGVSAWRVRRNDSPAYARVVGCGPQNDFIDSPELFARLAQAAPAADASRLAELYDAVFYDGGEAAMTVVRAAPPAQLPDGPVRPPELRGGVLSFWREDSDPHWTAPTTRLAHHVVDLSSGRASMATADDIAQGTRSADLVTDAGLHAARLRADAASARALVGVASSDPSADRRALALVMARGIADASLAQPLLSLASGDPAAEVRAAGIAALFATGDPSSAARARALAERESDPVAVAIVRRALSRAP